MANDKATSVLMNLPLEVRHTIFDYAAARDVKPKKLLRYWFEKKEVKEIIAQQATDNPGGPTPRVVHASDDYDEDSEVAEEEHEDQDSEEENDAAEQDQDENEEDEEAIEQDEGMDDEEVDEAPVEDEDDQLTTSAHNPIAAHTLTQTAASGDVEDEQAEAEMEDSNEELEAAGEENEVGAETQDTQNEVDDDGDEAMEEGDGAPEEDEDQDATATATQAPPQPSPPAPVVKAHRKWRHIPNFMRLTHRPPPVELLLASKQLNDEVKDWYYDVAVLRIQATGSFAHTSFFEEAFSQITEAAFSPMENIRKVEVTFVWDTTWIRADTTGCVDAIFPALLRQRSNFVMQILMQAPDLREVVIHWHDSAQDNESASLRLDVLEPFDNLPATIKIVEHYIAVDAKPHNRSIAGKRRVEFQNILDGGLDRLF